MAGANNTLHYDVEVIVIELMTIYALVFMQVVLRWRMAISVPVLSPYSPRSPRESSV